MKTKTAWKGRIIAEVYRAGKKIDTLRTENLVVDDGLNYALTAAFSGGAISSWYVGALNNSTPLASWGETEAVANEFTNYSEAARPLWAKTVTNNLATNTSSKAKITINADSQALYGAFLITSAFKGSDTGTARLFAAGTFTQPRTGLMTGDEVFLTYEVEAQSG